MIAPSRETFFMFVTLTGLWAIYSKLAEISRKLEDRDVS